MEIDENYFFGKIFFREINPNFLLYLVVHDDLEQKLEIASVLILVLVNWLPSE